MKVKYDNNILVILGMHRSGTSLTAQWLDRCGLSLGDNLLSGDFSNKKGHYEDLDFLNFHKDILNFNNWNKTGLNIENEAQFDISKYYKEKGKSLIWLKNNLREQWGWKEPRTCLFLDYYRQVLPVAKYFIVFRECEKVVDSLLRRDYNRLVRYYESQGIKGSVRKKLRLDYRKKEIEGKAELYQKQWIIYNKKILEHINKLSSESCLIYNLKDIHLNDKQILSQFKDWGFSLKEILFSDVYDTNLLKKEKSNLFHITISQEAKELEEEFLKIISNVVNYNYSNI